MHQARHAKRDFSSRERERERERENERRTKRAAAAAALGGAETVQRAADEIHRDEAKVEAVAIAISTKARRQTESAVNGERVVVVVVVVVVERVRGGRRSPGELV